MSLFKKLNKISAENPYLNAHPGRQEWNHCYENLARSRRYWQAAFAAAMSLAIILGFFIGKMAEHSSIQPFVIATNQGMPIVLQSAKAVSAADPQLVNYAMNQFITNARSVIADQEAEKSILTKVYAYSAKQTKIFLRDYYNAHDPFKIAEQFAVSVQIINSLPISHHTWQITWDETKFPRNGGPAIEKSRWMAQLHYELGAVNPQFVTDNPFGIYITEINWAQSQI
jgi:type IV secretion system protein TrbF